jgi:hypothetical protein
VYFPVSRVPSQGVVPNCLLVSSNRALGSSQIRIVCSLATINRDLELLFDNRVPTPSCHLVGQRCGSPQHWYRSCWQCVGSCRTTISNDGAVCHAVENYFVNPSVTPPENQQESKSSCEWLMMRRASPLAFWFCERQRRPQLRHAH